ncbi:hypothetical protein [Apilactobacillus ozensis]|uniref:hypothetical protein n=1 Tax=Apilactobacillus ozensis TaxID=866801 RepID=UPI000AF38CEA|nr:hypothetical protein [Apilactobacillus ozensis]
MAFSLTMAGTMNNLGVHADENSNNNSEEVGEQNTNVKSGSPDTQVTTNNNTGKQNNNTTTVNQDENATLGHLGDNNENTQATPSKPNDSPQPSQDDANQNSGKQNPTTTGGSVTKTDGNSNPTNAVDTSKQDVQEPSKPSLDNNGQKVDDVEGSSKPDSNKNVLDLSKYKDGGKIDPSMLATNLVESQANNQGNQLATNGSMTPDQIAMSQASATSNSVNNSVASQVTNLDKEKNTSSIK